MYTTRRNHKFPLLCVTKLLVFQCFEISGFSAVAIVAVLEAFEGCIILNSGVICVFAQVGKCLKDLIGGSKGLPYLKDKRYNLFDKEKQQIQRPPPNRSGEELINKLEKQEEIEKKKDSLYRKCS